MKKLIIIDLKQVQGKVSNALKTGTDTSMEIAKASKGFQFTKQILREERDYAKEFFKTVKVLKSNLAKLNGKMPL